MMCSTKTIPRYTLPFDNEYWKKLILSRLGPNCIHELPLEDTANPV